MITLIVVLFLALLLSNLGWVIAHSSLHNKYVALPKSIPASPVPECMCEHGINFHEDGNGPCGQTVAWNVRGNIAGKWEVFDKKTVCQCKRYVGPEPLIELYHPLEIGR